MKKTLLFFLGLMAFFANTQQKIDEGLKKELKEIFYWDQIYREYFDEFITADKKDQISKELTNKGIDISKLTWKNVVERDSLNLKKVEVIFKKYGYPGKSLVGIPENEAAWYVIQHSNKIDKYLPLIKEAGKKGELKFSLVAMMEDRNLMDKGEEQIYGSQGSGSFWEEKW